MGGKSRGKDGVACFEWRGQLADQFQGHAFVLALITKSEGVDDCVETSLVSEVVDEVNELAEDDVLSLIYYLFDCLDIAFIFIFLNGGLEVDVVKLLSHSFIVGNGRSVVQEVVLKGTRAPTEDLLQEVNELIGAQENGNVLIDQKEVGVYLNLGIQLKQLRNLLQPRYDQLQD